MSLIFRYLLWGLSLGGTGVAGPALLAGSMLALAVVRIRNY